MHDYHIIEKGQPVDQAAKALILLHGRGGSAQEILSLAYEFCDDTFYIAAPQATQNRWYPQSFMADVQLNEPWLTSAIETVKRLIDETAINLPKDKIYLMGFSQGACLALEVSSRYATRYGGVFAFTGGLIGSTINENNYQGDFEGTKVFIGTSDQDPFIPLIRSQQSKKLMEKLGADVTLKVYEGMPHLINKDEINCVNQLIHSS